MENAELYSSANGMQKKDAKEILSEFRDKIKWRSGGRILDVGCGSGEVTTEIILPQLPKDFKELIGLDVSQKMIQHARKSHSHCKIKFIELDIAQRSDNLLKEIMNKSEPPTKDSLDAGESEPETQKIRRLINGTKTLDCRNDRNNYGFDVILSFYCLHWITNLKLALRNMYKLLSPGGEVLLVFLVQSPIFTLYKTLSKMTLWKDYMQDVDRFIPCYQDSKSPVESFTKLVRAAGFLVLTSDCRKKNYIFDSHLSLKNAITAINPFIPRMPDGVKEDFINECLYQTKILNLATCKNDSYRVTYKLMVAHIRKPPH